MILVEFSFLQSKLWEACQMICLSLPASSWSFQCHLDSISTFHQLLKINEATDNFLATEVFCGYNLRKSITFSKQEIWSQCQRWDTWEVTDQWTDRLWQRWLWQLVPSFYVRLCYSVLHQDRISGCSAETSGAFWDSLASRSVSWINSVPHQWATLEELVVIGESIPNRAASDSGKFSSCWHDLTLVSLLF